MEPLKNQLKSRVRVDWADDHLVGAKTATCSPVVMHKLPNIVRKQWYILRPAGKQLLYLTDAMSCLAIVAGMRVPAAGLPSIKDIIRDLP